jgi:hypothetical protein
MIRASKAKLRLGSTILKISRGHDRRYKLLAAHTPDNANEEQLEFDTVILTGSSHHSKLTNLLIPRNLTRDSRSSTSRSSITHITHFATVGYISPGYFGMATGVELPDRILTTAKDSIDPELLAIERSEHYFSIESRSANAENREPEHEECATHDIGEEKLYRIISRHRIKDEELARNDGQVLDCGPAIFRSRPCVGALARMAAGISAL